MKEHQLPTKCICHKGFSGYSSVVARSNFRVGGQETTRNPLRHIHSAVMCKAKRCTCQFADFLPANFFRMQLLIKNKKNTLLSI